MTQLNLEKKIDEFITRKEIELARERRNKERFEAWEKNKPAVYSTFKFLGATALLAGALFIGSHFINTLPKPSLEEVKARKEARIEALQQDSTSYSTRNITLQSQNERLTQENKELSDTIAFEKSRRDFLGNLKPQYTRSQYTSQPQTTPTTNTTPQTTIRESTTPQTQNPTNQNTEQRRTTTQDNNNRTTTTNPIVTRTPQENQTTTQTRPTTRTSQESQTTHVFRLFGRGTENALITIWKQGEAYKQTTIQGGNYHINWQEPTIYFFADSITAERRGYQRAKIEINREFIPSRELQKNFFLEQLVRIEPTFKEQRGKLILQPSEKPYNTPLIVAKGQTVVIPAGYLVLGEEEFRIIVDGGTLEINGRQTNPVHITSLGGTWSGITYLNSQGNKIDYCEITNVQGYNSETGGAITLLNANLSLNNVKLKQNNSLGHGGNIRAQNSSLEIKNSFIDAGKATMNGGNIYLLNTKTDILQTQILNGRSQNGGNIYVENTKGNTREGLLATPLFIKGSQINYGTANNNGGGIAIMQALVETQQTTGTANRAAYGGAVYGTNGMYNFIRESYFRRNDATIAGGGAYFEGVEIIDDALRRAFQDNSQNNVVIKQ